MKKEISNIEKVDLSTLNYEELTTISKRDHQEDVRQYDKQQNALAITMIGAICLVCSVLFFILSFERKKNKMAGIDFGSLQFFTFAACLAAAIILLTIGLVRFFKAHKIRKALREEIMDVSRARKEINSSTNEKGAF